MLLSRTEIHREVRRKERAGQRVQICLFYNCLNYITSRQKNRTSRNPELSILVKFAQNLHCVAAKEGLSSVRAGKQWRTCMFFNCERQQHISHHLINHQIAYGCIWICFQIALLENLLLGLHEVLCVRVYQRELKTETQQSRELRGVLLNAALAHKVEWILLLNTAFCQIVKGVEDEKGCQPQKNLSIQLPCYVTAPNESWPDLLYRDSQVGNTKLPCPNPKAHRWHRARLRSSCCPRQTHLARRPLYPQCIFFSFISKDIASMNYILHSSKTKLLPISVWPGTISEGLYQRLTCLKYEYKIQFRRIACCLNRSI